MKFRPLKIKSGKENEKQIRKKKWRLKKKARERKWRKKIEKYVKFLPFYYYFSIPFLFSYKCNVTNWLNIEKTFMAFVR